MAKKKFGNGKFQKDAGSRERRFDRSRNDERTEDRQYQKKSKSSGSSPAFNDFSWYNGNPSLTAAAASLPFPYRPGMPMPGCKVVTVPTSGSVPTSIETQKVLPGILAINWAPSVGYSNAVDSPISVSAKQIYAKVRAAFSGELKVDAPDIVIYLCALDSIFSAIGALKRLYRIVSTYSPNNHYIPRTLLRALGVPDGGVDDLAANKTALYGYINELIGMTRRFICPAVFPMFNRHYWLNDNIYMDDASMNSQMYAFYMSKCYMWSLQTTTDGETKASGLEYVDWPTSMPSSGSYTYSLFVYVRNLINALAESSDAYTISGYLMRAFEGQPAFVIDELLQNEEFNPVYAPAVLQQIENTVAVGSEAYSRVYQDVPTNTIVNLSNASFDVTDSTRLLIPTPTLSIRSDVPTAEDVVEASRLMMIWEVTSWTKGDSNVTATVYCGTEFVENLYVYTFYMSNGALTYWNFRLAQLYYGISTVQVDRAAALSNFDWAPRLLIVGSGNGEYLLWDVHNVTSYSMDQARQINKICLYSEFNSFSIK